jgi:hypothetical protein
MALTLRDRGRAHRYITGDAQTKIARCAAAGLSCCKLVCRERLRVPAIKETIDACGLATDRFDDRRLFGDNLPGVPPQAFAGREIKARKRAPRIWMRG